MLSGMTALRKLRLHLEERDGTLRNAAQVTFTGRDASLYLIPYATHGEYFYGVTEVPAGQAPFTFSFRDQLTAGNRPKVSIHESGQVHIYADGSPRTEPLQIPPLRDYRGEHIATVRYDAIETMPKNTRTPKAAGQRIDVTFGVPPDVLSGSLLIYANGEANLFQTEHVHFAIQVDTAPGKPPMYYGLTGIADDPIGDAGGVTVLAGFDARKAQANQPTGMAFLRGY
jgi:hypothetical protein